jgi:hypothetical protein
MLIVRRILFVTGSPVSGTEILPNSRKSAGNRLSFLIFNSETFLKNASRFQRSVKVKDFSSPKVNNTDKKN